MKTILFFLFYWQTCIVNAQIHSYNLSGEIKGVSEGKIYLAANTNEKKYYGRNSMLDSAIIGNGKFLFKREIFDKNVYPYRLIVKSHSVNGTTGTIFIQPKNQVIILDTINEYNAPLIVGSIHQSEMINKYEPFFRTFINEVAGLNSYEDQLYEDKNLPTKETVSELTQMKKRIEARGDSLFFEYSKKNNDSYITFWKLIERFKNFGFKDQFLEIFNLLSYKIKYSNTGKLFYKDIITDFSYYFFINSGGASFR